MAVKLTPKDFFLNVAAMAALYVSVISFIALLFQYIDTLFPKDINGFQDPYSSGISFARAALIIVFPAYIFFTRVLNEDIRKNPEKRDLGIHKWLIFITLFIAGITIVVDLIILLHTFFSGQELTVGFLLKVFVVLIILGGVFWYYAQSLKGIWQREEKLSKAIGGVVAVLVLVSIISGFFIMGSPHSNRLVRIDFEKVQDLQSIQWQIVRFWQEKEVLPQTLSELEDPLVGFTLSTDPQTGESYGYDVIGERTFELCAVFNRPNRDTERLVRPGLDRSTIFYGFDDANWQHGEGETCFERTIDPDRFPPVKDTL